MSIFDNREEDILDQWIYSFKNHEVKEGFEAPGIKEMSEKFDYLDMSAEKKRAYNKYKEDLASDRGTLEYAKSEGEMIGIEKGIQKGIKKGIIETARKFLKAGSEPSFVAKVTGLNLEEVNKLQ